MKIPFFILYMSKIIDSRTAMLGEYAKCKADYTYAIETYLQTFDARTGGFVPFKLFTRQKEFVYNLMAHQYNIADKPRQAGVSTTVAAYLATVITLAPPSKPEKILILANKLKSAKELLKKVRTNVSQYPAWMWGSAYDYSKTVDGHIVGQGSTEKINFVNGTEIVALATSEDALRGYTPTILVIDEAAFIDNGADVFTAALPSISTGGKMILISTPNGFDSLYYKVFLGAKSGENTFKITSFRWYEDPRYNEGLTWSKTNDKGVTTTIKEDYYTITSISTKIQDGWKPSSAWYRNMCANMNHDKKKIAQELDVKFEGSSGLVIEYEHIEKQESEFTCEPILKTGFDKNIWVWKYPEEGHIYVLGGDVASGNSDDYSAFSIIDGTTGEQVVEYKGKLRPEDFAKIIYEWGLKYNALTIIDVTGGYGDVVIQELERAEYPLLYVDPKRNLPGIKILINNRNPMITKFVSYFENYDLIVRSKRAINETKTYIWLNGRPDHMPGFNDDVLMTLVMAIYVLDTAYKAVEDVKNKKFAALSWMSNVENTEKITQTPSIVTELASLEQQLLHNKSIPVPVEKKNENETVINPKRNSDKLSEGLPSIMERRKNGARSENGEREELENIEDRRKPKFVLWR